MEHKGSCCLRDIEKLIGKSVGCGTLLRLFTSGRSYILDAGYLSCGGQSTLFAVQHYYVRCRNLRRHIRRARTASQTVYVSRRVVGKWAPERLWRRLRCSNLRRHINRVRVILKELGEFLKVAFQLVNWLKFRRLVFFLKPLDLISGKELNMFDAYLNP